MPPIPAKLNARLYKVLAQCGPFDTHQALRAVFADERLYSWRNAIPETTTRADRIATLIDTLHDQFTVAGDNALVLFLRVLDELVESPDNQCHCDLVSLANELENQFKIYSTLQVSGPSEERSKEPEHSVSKALEPVLSEPQTQDKEAIAWFANIRLIGNPFEHLTAEEDEALSSYQIQLQEVHSLEGQIRGDDTASRWIIFAKRGCGKTTLCQMVRRSHYPFKKDHILSIMLDAEALNNVLAYAAHALETLLPIHYIKVVEDLIQDSVKISKLAYTSGVSACQALSALAQVIIGQGFKYLLCLVDQVDEVELVEAQPEKMVQLLKPLMQLSQQTLPGVAFRYFLPAEIESLMQAQHAIFRLDRYQVVHLRWTEDDLRQLIKQRLTAFSKSALNPYISLGQLCEPGTNFDAPIDRALVRLAEGSPRAVVWLANRLIQVHCQAENPPRFIQPATWQQVKADWRLYGREQLFGSPARSEAFVLAGDRIYFQGEEVILSKKYDALLRCLIQAGDRVCTKEELIRAGWPGEAPAGVTEAALAEAVRRMKVELKKLGYDPAWVRTVRGRGYRLQKPKAPGVR